MGFPISLLYKKRLKPYHSYFSVFTFLKRLKKKHFNFNLKSEAR